MPQPLDYLRETASQTAGPYVHIGLAPGAAGFQIFRRELGWDIAGPNAPGERIRVEGTMARPESQDVQQFGGRRAQRGPAQSPHGAIGHRPGGEAGDGEVEHVGGLRHTACFLVVGGGAWDTSEA